MGIKAAIQDYFLKGSSLTGMPLITDDDVKPAYKNNKAITGLLPWLDIVDENKILLADARTLAAVYEITPIATEARSDEHLQTIRDGINSFIGGTFEEHSMAPWVVSTYCWCDSGEFRSLTDNLLSHAIRVHAQRDAELTPYSEHFIKNVFGPHVNDMSQPNGLFKDPLNGRAWGGSKRKVYLVFYRRQFMGIQRRKGMTANRELENQCKRVSQMLKAASITSKRLGGEAIRDWLFRWGNPNPTLTKGDTDAWLALNPHCTEDMKTADFDLSADVMSRDVRGDKKTQCWYFDGMPHTLLSIERMTKVPEVGQTSAERYESKEERSGPNARTSCFMDELPTGSMLIVNYVVQPQNEIRKHLEKLEKNSRGDTPEAEATRDEVKNARSQIARGNKLYPYSMAIALRADNDDAMEDAILETDTLLLKNNFTIIDPEYDQFRLDRYVRFMPCAYDTSLDQVAIRQRIIYTHHLANILPFYGRGIGTGNPCIVAFNRGGETFSCDPLLQGDRAKNAHLFLFGPTGAGKSATLVYLQMLITAVYNPRWVVVEAGNSFGLLSTYLKKHGKSVVDIVMRPGQAPSIAPFKAALDLVDMNGNIIQATSVVEDVLNGDAELEDADKGDNEDEIVSRDVLGEMLIIARLMVTGGEKKEEERMNRSDLGLLKKALLDAAIESRLAKSADVLPEQIIKALRAQIHERPQSSQRISEMADAMDLFCDGFAGELFNRPGEELPDADYIRIEMGALASGNDTNDKLSVAYISIINQVIARAQRTQRDGRPTINLTDEAHVLTTNPLLAKYLVVVSKLLGRRMGLWLWQATQNMKDYPDESEKMLAMFEWWMCLFIDSGELTNIERFKKLSEDQRLMLLSTRKASGKYTEGVIMSDNVQGLFRIVPPGLCLALGQTEKEEKRARMKLMKAHSIDESEAAEMIGAQMAYGRRTRNMNE